MKRALGVFVVIVSLGCLALLYWGRAGTVITLIVTDGFHGKIAIVEDPSATASFTWTCGKEGVVRVRSAAVLYDWHSFQARYESGTAIPEATPLDGTRRLRRETMTVCLFTGNNGLFVGTPSEAARMQYWYFRDERQPASAR